MYRHNIPRFMVPPPGIRGHHPGPPPPQSIALRMQGSFHQEVPYNQRKKETNQSNPPQSPVPPPAVKETSPSVNKWKSSFTTVGEDDKDNSSSRSGTDDNEGTKDVHQPESSTDTTLEKRKRVRTRPRKSVRKRNWRLRMMAHGEDNTSSQLYDPYEAVSDDTPSPAPQKDLQDSRGRWDIEANMGRRRLSPAPPLFPSRDTDSTDRTRYSTAGDHGASDYRTEMSSKVRLSPAPLPHNYKQSPGFTALDQLPPPRQEIKEPVKNEEITDKNLISCDLCEVELSNGQELEEHLDSKCHWDTLEYIQKNNNYDDMAIAFLQDVMMYKSRKCSRAIEDTALQALQEYDHMTKVEMFHCAACNLFISTSAFAVQNHITTQQHMANTKGFQVQQRRSCLDKANTMMKELTPQFQCFVKGMSPFE